jgi:hypothetical protein
VANSYARHENCSSENCLYLRPMSKYDLLRNAWRLHEIISESRPGVPLTSNVIALKLRSVRPVRLSEKQITRGIKFLRDLGYPVEYHGSEHRWFYNWDPKKVHPALLEQFASTEGPFPKPTFAVLLVLRHGLDALEGTPMWSEAKKFFEKALEEALWKQTRDMGELFSVRPREGASIQKGVFDCLSRESYQSKESATSCRAVGLNSTRSIIAV